jgi:hypothetical protein
MAFVIMTEVVEVKTKLRTEDPDATAASSRFMVPCTFTATKSDRERVATWGLWRAPAWTTAVAPFITSFTTDASTIEPTTSVVGDGTTSMPTTL